MVESRHAPPAGSESFRDRDQDSWPPLTDADREVLRVRRRERLQDIVTKTCGPLIKSAMQHHVSVRAAAGRSRAARLFSVGGGRGAREGSRVGAVVATARSHMQGRVQCAASGECSTATPL